MRKHVYQTPQTLVHQVAIRHALLEGSDYVPVVPGGGGGFDAKEENEWDIDWEEHDL